MTLLIAGIDGQQIWMVSDAAVTGGDIDLRRREYLPKIEVGQNGRSLIGFSGDVSLGRQYIKLAQVADDAQAALEILVNGSLNSAVDYAFAFFESEQPILLRISNGRSKELSTLHLGSDEAFETFQQIRLGESNPYAPLALKTYIFGAPTDLPAEKLVEATRCMIDLFASRPEHDVGGWAVPYLIDSKRAYFCQYVYSVSDPLFDRIAPGSIVPHGTQEGGGSTLSVTAYGDQEGMVVYWLQLAGGAVYVRKGDDYERYVFAGDPAQFKHKVEAVLGKTIDLWVNNQELGPIKKLVISRDKITRNINTVIAYDGRSFTIAAHNLATPFISHAELSVVSSEQKPPQGIEITIGSAKDSVLVRMPHPDGIKELTFDAKELDSLMLALSEARANLLPPVPADIPERLTVMVQIDPRWITNQSPIPDVPGTLLHLRHSGLGWLGFILPSHEACALGKWLSENAPKTSETLGENEKSIP